MCFCFENKKEQSMLKRCAASTRLYIVYVRTEKRYEARQGVKHLTFCYLVALHDRTRAADSY